jgi:steroid 5-alpha reductase family enzyme
VAGPVAITTLFLFVSVPMMDRRNLERRPGYGEHMKRVSALFP